MSEPTERSVAGSNAVVEHRTWLRAKTRAMQAIARGGIVTLVGRPGVGKTTLLLELEQDLIANQADVVWLDQASGFAGSRLGIALSDQADDLAPATLRALAKRSVASVLVGGDTLTRRLQQIGAKHTVVRVVGVSLADTADYVATTRHRLGRPSAAFDGASTAVLHTRTLGIPRLLDLTADMAVFLMSLEGADRVLPSHVEAAFSSSADLVEYGQDGSDLEADEQDDPDDEHPVDRRRRRPTFVRLTGPAIALASSVATLGVVGAVLHWPLRSGQGIEAHNFGPVRLGAVPMNPVADAAGLDAAISTAVEVARALARPPSDDAGPGDSISPAPPPLPAGNQTGTTALAETGLAPDPGGPTQAPSASTTDPATASTSAVELPPTQAAAASSNQTSPQQDVASSRDDTGLAVATPDLAATTATSSLEEPLTPGRADAHSDASATEPSSVAAPASPSAGTLEIPRITGSVSPATDAPPAVIVPPVGAVAPASPGAPTSAEASTQAGVSSLAGPALPGGRNVLFPPQVGLTPQDLGDLGPPPLGDAGLVLVVRPGDTLPMLYARVYRGSRRPPYSSILSINSSRIKVGGTVVFPAPAEGWNRR